MADLITLLRKSTQTLARAPLFTGTAVFSLALGIGLSTAVFSIIAVIRFTPLPFTDPGGIVEVMSTVSPDDHRVADYLTYDRLRGWVEGDFRTMSLFAGSGEANLVLREADGPRALKGWVVLGDLFEVLGVEAARGRVLTPADDDPGASPATVVSHRLGERLSSGGRDALGQVLHISGTAYTVVGVMPREMTGGEAAWIPASLTDIRHGAWKGTARLRPGFTPGQAATEIQKLAAAQVSEDPVTTMGQGATAFVLGGRARTLNDPTLLILAGLAALVFLLGLANLTNLSMVRAAGRSRELAVRASLGGGRWQLGEGLATEGLLLGLAGTLGGILLAAGGKDLLHRMVLASGTLPMEPVLDLRVLVFAAALGLVASLTLAAEPLRRVGRLELRDLLQQGTGKTTLSREERRTRDTLVAVQVALCLILVAAGGAILTALDALRSLDLGYDAADVVEAVPDYAMAATPAPVQRELAAAVTTRLRVQPAVETAAFFRLMAQEYPPRPESTAIIQGVTRELGTFEGLYRYYEVGPGFFRVMGMEPVRGRGFGPGDGPGAPQVGIITEAGAQAWWPGEDPIGKQVRLGEAGEGITVVGVIRDAQVMEALGLIIAAPTQSGRTPPRMPLLFRPAAQCAADTPGWLDWLWGIGDGYVVVARPASSTAAATAALRTEMTTLAPDLPLAWLGTFQDRQVRFGGSDLILHQRLVVLAGAGALLLALLGLFAVAAEGVTRRTRELGIRLALGASAPALARTVLRESALTAAAGIGVGLALVAAFSRVGNTLLVPRTKLGLGVGHPGLLAGAAAGVLLICMVAAVLGGRRALRLDPAEALRVE